MDKKVDPLEDTRAESIRPGKLIAGAPIGGYNLLEVLGEGGMGVVWSAHDPLLDRQIAIKVLKSGDASPQLRMRLLREGRAMAKLKHPNVLTVFEVGTEGERDFIAMELVEGGPLDHWLATHPPRDEVMAALLAAGRGLAAAHTAGLVHRDFKPNNVLRSTDGRVLVTDFGLARGIGDDWGAALSASGNKLEQAPALDAHRDSVLHSPLTRTGAMIGTPAYMAPEQFVGAEPDPRTDQFAFCVTAWQALTGARPFHGKTLEELRQAANAGVAMVISDLPRPLRGVLARGLDPDPDKRWPDLKTLLAEFEQANQRRAPRWPLYAGAVGVVAVGAIVAIKLASGSAPKVSACEPADAVWADATGKQDDRRIAGAFENHKKRWLAAYDQTCKGDPKPRGTDTKVACLRAIRDRTAAMAEVVTGGSPAVAKAFDPFTMLQAPEVCAAGVVPVPVPGDARRDSVISLIRAALESPVALRDDRRVFDWPPLAPMLELDRGFRLLRSGDHTGARTAFESARLLAEPVDPRTNALARIALLEASVMALEHPETPTKRDAMHAEIQRLLMHAKSDVKTAGNEPILVGLLAMREAEATADLAERAPKTLGFGDAKARVTEARAQFELLGDVRRIGRAAALAAEIELRRGDGSALTNADHIASPASELLAREGEPPLPGLETVLARVAFARGDYDVAAKAYDQIRPVTAASTHPAHEGVVLDVAGKPVMSATVVAWTGELLGDPRHLVTDRRTLTGEVVETGVDGKFSIHAPAGAAIIAQRGDAVSAPVVVGDKITLQLAATTEVTGKVDGKAPLGLVAFARLVAGEHSWLVRSAVARDGQTFRIAHLPAGAKPQFGAQLDTAGTTHRVIAPSATKIVWPDGLQPIDVIVTGTLGAGARIYLFNHRVNVNPLAKVSELDKLVATGTEVAFGTPVPVGSRITEVGRVRYVAGAHHAIVLGDVGGSACVASSNDDAEIACAEVTDGAVLIELP